MKVSANDCVEPAEAQQPPSSGPLAGLTINILSSGHVATDHRLFDKEGRSLAQAGATVRIFAVHDRREVRDGVELIPIPKPGGRLKRFLLTPWVVYKASRSEPAPVVHIHDLEMLLVCPYLKLIGQPIIIYDVHEDFAHLMLRRDWIPKPLRPLVNFGLRAVERLFSYWVDGVVAVTGSLADDYGHKRYRTAAYNLPSRAFAEQAGRGALPPEKRAFDIVHLGVLTRERMEFLADVFDEVLKRRPDARFRTIGQRPEQVAWLRSRFPDPDSADVLGRVPYDQVSEKVRQCRMGVNVHPVLYPHLRVAVPVKVFEYMACGCPVVTSWLPELDNLLDEETRQYVPILKDAGPEAYAHELVEMLNAPERLSAASRFVMRAARERYSWEAQAGKLVSFYQRLLREKNVPWQPGS